MKIAIIGSRDFNDKSLLNQILEPYKSKITYIISGGARGADTLGEEWANENGVKTQIFYANWDKHGKQAGFIRNVDIIESCDGCIAFWDGESKGTKHSLSLCEKLGKPVKIVKYV